MNFIRSIINWIKGLFAGIPPGGGGGGGEFLCDTCMYDYGDACTRPERPNARKCPDYKRR